MSKIRKILSWIPIVGVFTEIYCGGNYLSDKNHLIRFYVSIIYHSILSLPTILFVILVLFAK